MGSVPCKWGKGYKRQQWNHDGHCSVSEGDGGMAVCLPWELGIMGESFLVNGKDTESFSQRTEKDMVLQKNSVPGDVNSGVKRR